ncbi:Calnexin-like [Hondaea fermentalgiana]|uniref:Calnexin-like n=1 Tax=Hondaea fermentalgiana TaxID=2315210 RepID=A0A2R5GHN8_9STRA|nr:Calnexin-like [Hondaea fermentalgiana]|eukprot:GBG28163.1 Calnexin-like [Hondaea fermentalgiana]
MRTTFVAAYAAVAALALGQCEAINFRESFEGANVEKEWVKSASDRYAGSEWTFDTSKDTGDVGLQTVKPHKFYGISRKFENPIPVGDGEKPFVAQYEVKFTEGVSCSGAYLKLLEQDDAFTPKDLVESSPYSIMFGPDNCGANNKVHLIFRQENPVTKEYEEKHMTKKVTSVRDRTSHVYTLEVHPDNTFKVKVDGKVEAEGSLTDDEAFSPPFQQPKEIDDPNDEKPDDWVDQAKIPDPEASKPDDWDEDAPKRIADPDAVKPEGWLDDEPDQVPDPAASEPEDWDEEDDGIWEAPLVANPKCTAGPGCGEWNAPMIDNPNYKGKWSAPMIDNPEYKGVWKPRRIENPAYFEEASPVTTIKPIGAVAIEILANDKGLRFDNIIIGNDVKEAADFIDKEFLAKQADEKAKVKEEAAQAAQNSRWEEYKKGSIQGYVMWYAGDYIDYVMELYEASPIAVGLGAAAAGLAVLVALMVMCMSGAPEEYDDDVALHKKDDDAAAGDDDEAEAEAENDAADEDDDEEEDDDDEDDDEDEATGPRRRVNRAN